MAVPELAPGRAVEVYRRGFVDEICQIIAIDDFGTDFSSPSDLSRPPVHTPVPRGIFEARFLTPPEG